LDSLLSSICILPTLNLRTVHDVNRQAYGWN
jgi:hypothetical protein